MAEGVEKTEHQLKLLKTSIPVDAHPGLFLLSRPQKSADFQQLISSEASTPLRRPPQADDMGDKAEGCVAWEMNTCQLIQSVKKSACQGAHYATRHIPIMAAQPLAHTW